LRGLLKKLEGEKVVWLIASSEIEISPSDGFRAADNPPTDFGLL
jgi:hypothetical protein